MTVVTDVDGRKLTVRPLDPGDLFDVMEMAGEHSTNIGWMSYAMTVCSVSEIEGVPVPLPRSGAAVKELARRLGNAGLAAIRNSVMPDAGDAEAAKN